MNLRGLIFAKLFGETIAPTMYQYTPTTSPDTANLRASVLNQFDPQIGLNVTLIQNDTELDEIRKLALPKHFAIGDQYQLLENSVCDWRSSKIFPNAPLPLLREISYSSKLCPVMINDHIIFVIGALKDLSSIQTAVEVRHTDTVTIMGALNDEIVATEASPNKLYEIDNPGFIGAEILAYSYDGNLGGYTAQSTLDSDTVIDSFRYVLSLAWIRRGMQACIVYTGDQSNPLVAQLIKTVNNTIPVFSNLDQALDYVRHDYFKTKFPDLELQANGCPIGEQAQLNKLELQPFTCTSNFPIHGVSKGAKDYGVKFQVTDTNRWFKLNVTALRNNGTLATFTMRFGRDKLEVYADQSNKDIIAPIGIPDVDHNSTNTTIEFPYNQFINSQSYTVRLKPVLMKFGLDTNVLTVEVRKQGEMNFNEIGFFMMYGQPRTIQFCGFSPADNKDGVKLAHTLIEDVQSRFINSGLKYKPK